MVMLWGEAASRRVFLCLKAGEENFVLASLLNAKPVSNLAAGEGNYLIKVNNNRERVQFAWLEM